MSGETDAAREVSPDYAAGLLFAADVAHAEARWQLELAYRNGTTAGVNMVNHYASERAAKVEAAIRAVAECVTPPDGAAS